MPQERKENFFTELLKFIVIAALIVFPIRFFVAQPFIVSGASMDPTFQDGEYLIIDELTYHFNDPKRGDVVVFHPPHAQKEFYIKRIIGLPGESVTIQNGTVMVKTAAGEVAVLDEPQITHVGNGGDATHRMGKDEYFVLGDNRPESSDSRVWGVLPRKNIAGRAIIRLLPVNKISLFPGAASYPQ